MIGATDEGGLSLYTTDEPDCRASPEPYDAE